MTQDTKYVSRKYRFIVGSRMKKYAGFYGVKSKNKTSARIRGTKREREEEKSVYCKRKDVSKYYLLTRFRNAKHGQLDSTVILNVNTMSAVLSE